MQGATDLNFILALLQRQRNMYVYVMKTVHLAAKWAVAKLSEDCYWLDSTNPFLLHSKMKAQSFRYHSLFQANLTTLKHR